MYTLEALTHGVFYVVGFEPCAVVNRWERFLLASALNLAPHNMEDPSSYATEGFRSPTRLRRVPANLLLLREQNLRGFRISGHPCSRGHIAQLWMEHKSIRRGLRPQMINPRL